MKTSGRPCASCPWRRAAGATDIPNFDLELAEKLAGTCPDHRGMGPDYGASMFACHQSRQGEEFACAGWLAKVGHRHPAVRLAVAAGRLDPAALKPGVDWPELHDSYREVLDKLRETLNFEDGINGDKPAVKIG
ncbi:MULTISPECIES: DUF6283 family protein [Burkholderia]|uniref:DUF6283 family protein n=1 Tax=Burkholderia TaxID=32008 RepID=UPI001C88EE5F|nr:MULTISPECIES: DUF6283 family protein [Burkholderia]